MWNFFDARGALLTADMPGATGPTGPAGPTGPTGATGAAGGAGTNAALLPLDIVPSSPHASDDEFPGTSLDGKWTDPITSARINTLSVADDWLRVEPSDAGTGSTGVRGGWGIRQNAPAGSFTISAKIADGPGDVAYDDSRIGIFVADSVGAVGHIIGINSTNLRIPVASDFIYSESSTWGANAGYDSPQTDQSMGREGTRFRIVWDAGSSTLFFYYSSNGIFWKLFASHTGQSQPDRIGIAIWSFVTDVRADHKLGCDWFRVTEP